MPDDVQAIAQRILDRMVEQGEPGLQIAVWHRGKLVVDAWAGRNIDGRSLFPIYSTGKGIAATAVHILVQRGTLSYDDPVARWWPEFAANGKAGITLRMCLNHTAGMAMLHEGGTMEDLADWDGMCRRFAAMAPLPAPGTERHYHAISYSWLLGETARRADGRPFARIIAEEVARPLGLTGLHFGVPESEMHRVQDAEAAPPKPPAGPPVPPAPPAPPKPTDIIPGRAIPAYVTPLEGLMNNVRVRRACIPASNGIMDARSIAKHYAALLAPIDGVRLLSDATLDEALANRPVSNEGARARFGLGYGLNGPDEDPGAQFGHGGYGGSTGFADRRHGLAVGFTRSRMNGIGSEELIGAIRAALGCA